MCIDDAVFGTASDIGGSYASKSPTSVYVHPVYSTNLRVVAVHHIYAKPVKRNRWASIKAFLRLMLPPAGAGLLELQEYHR